MECVGHMAHYLHIKPLAFALHLVSIIMHREILNSIITYHKTPAIKGNGETPTVEPFLIIPEMMDLIKNTNMEY